MRHCRWGTEPLVSGYSAAPAGSSVYTGHSENGSPITITGDESPSHQQRQICLWRDPRCSVRIAVQRRSSPAASRHRNDNGGSPPNSPPRAQMQRYIARHRSRTRNPQKTASFAPVPSKIAADIFFIMNHLHDLPLAATAAAAPFHTPLLPSPHKPFTTIFPPPTHSFQKHFPKTPPQKFPP